MAAWWITAVAVGAVLLCVAAVGWRPLRARLREKQLARARRDFHLQRERLEAKFLTLASRSGKPRGLDWVRCDFEDAVLYARHRQSGELWAFVGVTIGFEAIAGGGMEEVEAVSNLARPPPSFGSKVVAGPPTAVLGSTSRRPKPLTTTRIISNSWPKSLLTTMAKYTDLRGRVIAAFGALSARCHHGGSIRAPRACRSGRGK